jgi:hypothetical protein
MSSHLRNLLRDRRGNAMIGALLVLLVISAMGVAYVALSKTETNIAGHEKRYVQSMFNAEAGVAEALSRLSSRDTTEYFGEDLDAGAPTPGWGAYMVMASGNSSMDPDVADTAADTLDNDGDGSIDESGEVYPEVLSLQGGDSDIEYPWVRVRYRLTAANEVVLFGDHDNNPGTAPRANLTAGWPIIQATAEGNQGTAQRRIEVEAVRAPFSVPKAAIYAESDNFKFNGTQFLVSGKDWDPATGDTLVGAEEVDGIQTTGTPQNIIDELNGNQQNNVEGDGPEPAIDNADFDYDLQAMIDAYSGMADDVHDGGTVSNGSLPDWGNYEDYRIVHVTDDLHISGSLVGGGLLLLEGDLTVSGSFTWYGLVINMGTITFTGGGGDIHLYGSVMTSGGFDTNVVGGNADVLYSSKALSKLSGFNRYRISAWTELP